MKLKGNDIAMLSNHYYKKFHVLNLINHHSSISRTKLSDITDYRAATISDIVKELIDEQIIVERGSIYAGQGRRRTLLEINNDYLCTIGVVIYPPMIEIVICSSRGEIWERLSYPFDENWSANQIIDLVIKSINGLAAKYCSKKILGIGICDPGVVAANREYSVSSVYIKGWKNIRLKSMVEYATKLPVTVSSRVYLTALAEQKIGLAQGQSDFICLVLSKGIGLSFVCNNRVVNGHTAMAGQIGHTYVHDNDKPCYCGNLGCVESSCSLPAIIDKISSALKSGCNSVLYTFRDHPDAITVDDIRSAIESHDRLCINVIKHAARLIGIALANTINILNPQSVIMSGEMVAFGDEFLSVIIESAKEHIIPIFNMDIEFVVSNLMDSTLLLGAATLVYSEFLQSDSFFDLYSATVDDTGTGL
ncbi:MAG: ROK family protein [Clostridia bacterium]